MQPNPVYVEQNIAHFDKKSPDVFKIVWCAALHTRTKEEINHC